MKSRSLDVASFSRLACALAALLALPAAAAAAAPPQRLIVRFHDTLSEARADAQVRRTLAPALARAQGASAATGVAVRRLRRLGNGAELLGLPTPLPPLELERLIEEIAADPAVRYVEPDRLQRIAAAPVAVPDDPDYAARQWHLHEALGGANVPAAWPASQGEGVVVAVLDTGILPDHPDFARARLLEGYDFVREPFMSRREQAGTAPGALDRGDWSALAGECGASSRPEESSWHGTHVAGTIAQTTGNGLGGASVAPRATLLPVRVLGRCGGWISDIVDGLTWASGGEVRDAAPNPHPAQVINLSLGGRGACGRAYQEAIDAAVSRGSVVVVAAGNTGADARAFSPASCRNVIAVAATGAGGGMAGYSNYGAPVALSAPGGDFLGGMRGFVWQAGYTGTTTPTSGEYTSTPMGGTSMAAPHVAGVAALVQGARVARGKLPLAPSRMAALLAASARPFPVEVPAGKPIGSGILDAGTAMAMALDRDCDIAVRDCAPARVLVARVPASGQSGDAVGRRYTFTARAGQPLRVTTYGGSGEVTLYVRHGAPPQADAYDARSAREGTHETVLIARPQAAQYQVWLAGAPSFDGVTIAIRQ
ncbi:S8 family serine peptidase [Stenotrophomonas sp. HITSZ_GD]|uniref:S8 family serine peptidase n=1 Tax=Stenotrophomonas sp. HITSZ_GD TaxID=3037248 RepID=UPI00240DE2D1|nr:S8 family serine peptidase [Stenotrophomonas sp. HITSZ_GD]MDG2525678.1 S8 family serine peptidase [Stenotrophomonas sp. HITSZ_GD]